MLGSAFNVQAGYIFTSLLSIDAQYTHINSDKYSFLNNPAFYARPNYYTLGLTKFVARNHSAKIQASFTYVDADDTATDNKGQLINGHEWMGRIMMTFGF